ncbi:MBL fold metallo-hydrolase [Sphaerisporangium sp. TRM90804]|uniref:MBL fold metallo-hydrolase n=1 Tax=Sphaerisporangium sp. TRM90804 TaxID=3031113 RepID=UPI00244858AA|nr:MBL fold metallo-hydrolase [Sphaerisporangium sp. TRM90804]MDH2429476.1 MBL fold metallo-hydrolase [Sphaerisporangium sp. TRM90804]
MTGSRTARRVLAGGAAVAAAGWALRDVAAELGARPLREDGPRAARIRRSPQFADGVFRNPMPGETRVPSGPPPRFFRELLTGREGRRPSGPVPLAAPRLGGPAADGLAVVWFGHASTLVEIEGRRVLFDPVWSTRVSPTRLVGPRRLHPVPVALAALPRVDAVVISHDHYDHLDLATVRALTRAQQAPFLVPLGIGAHLSRWGVPGDRVIELDWEEEAEVAGLRFTATAARHFSGRSFSRNDTLWGSWAVAGPNRRVFYAGDSGYFDGYARIGADHGPFDLTLMPVGAYSPAWPDIHMDPEEAVEAHVRLGGELMLPVHWATFTLALHPWGEPVDRLWREAKARDVRVVVPRPGDRVDAGAPPAVDGWWETLA